MTTAPVTEKTNQEPGSLPALRFDFARDTFAFANELLWEYHFDAASGTTSFQRRQPKPDYALRCFVLVRAVRQFFYHARFEAALPKTDDEKNRRLVRAILSRNPRKPSGVGAQIVLPGYRGLREFSQERERLLKDECGGAWRSYVLRSHWRMVCPISRAHQTRTAAQLQAALRENRAPIVHLVRFPALTINHGMIIFDSVESSRTLEFHAYDPNDPAQPTCLTFDQATRTFTLPKNRYWAGGKLDIIEIFRSWIL